MQSTEERKRHGSTYERDAEIGMRGEEQGTWQEAVSWVLDKEGREENWMKEIKKERKRE